MNIALSILPVLMSKPIQIIYEPYYRKFKKLFIETLPFVYYDYQVGNNENELKKIQQDFERCITLNTDSIYIATSAEINTYLNDFSVKPNGTIDEFKIIFFLAKALNRFLKRDGLHTVAKVSLLIMLYQLNFRLNSVQAHRPQLTRQSIRMIKNSILFEKTGEVGLYLTYKCLYRHAEENQKKS